MWSKRKNLFLFFAASFIPALNARSETRCSSWYVYWDPLRVEAATDRYLSQLDHIGLFGVHFDSQGHLTSDYASLAETLTSIKARMTPRQKIYLTAVNDIRDGKRSKQKDPFIVHDRLASPSQIDAHIKDLLTLAADFDGIEIDYEALRQADRENFTRFIQQLAQETHKQKKLLSVIVEPKTADILSNGAGAIDWTQISRAADRVKIMAYYLHYPGGDPGPVATTVWVEQIARFALTQIPREKLSIILVVNGVDWSDSDKGRTIDYETAMGIAAAKKQRVKRDRKSGALNFQYSDKDVRHEVWLEDANSLNDKLKMLQQLGINNIGLWRLGSGDPAFWEKINQR